MRIKTSIAALVFFAALLAGPLAHATGSAAPAFSISLAPPAGAFDLSDFDARDQFNRPIVNGRARLEQLFVRSMYDLLLLNRTAIQRAANFVLSRTWFSSGGWLGHKTRAFTSTIVAALENRARLFFLRCSGMTQALHLHFNEAEPRHASFLFLLSLQISSTRLLR